MKKIAIIGGGIAGLSAAAFLSQNFNVTIFEASPYLGGRAKSFLNPTTNTYYDNGQHLLAGAYKYTIEFLNLINAIENFYFQNNLEIIFITDEKEKVKFSFSESTNKLKRLISFLNFDLFNLFEKISIILFLNKIKKLNPEDYANYSAASLLNTFRQSPKICSDFWNVIIVSTLNCSPKLASARSFIEIIQSFFFSDPSNSVLIFPKYDLKKSYIDPAVDYLNKKNININLNSKVNKINFVDNLVESIEVNNKKLYFDEYILATAPFDLIKILGNKVLQVFPNFTGLHFSPIISINIWFEKIELEELFYYLLGSELQWVFKKEDHISIVISDAEKLINYSKEELINLTIKELKKYLELDFDKILDYKIIKSKRATFIPTNFSYEIRPFENTPFKNLLLAGDYTNTGLPSTIESAVISGKICSEIINKKY